MQTNFSVYEELVYSDQDDGSCNWEGRLYKRGVSGGPVETTKGEAANREEARAQFAEWKEKAMAPYACVEERLDVETFEIKGRTISVATKVFLTQEELDNEKAADAANTGD